MITRIGGVMALWVEFFSVRACQCFPLSATAYAGRAKLEEEEEILNRLGISSTYLEGKYTNMSCFCEWLWYRIEITRASSPTVLMYSSCIWNRKLRRGEHLSALVGSNWKSRGMQAERVHSCFERPGCCVFVVGQRGLTLQNVHQPEVMHQPDAFFIPQ